MDALLSTVQMPTGVPVATVAINGAGNAALLAIQMLALSDDGLANKLEEKKRADREKALEKDAKVFSDFNN
jgi:5-(carboxyamino)imidazole ribonucleotide mutase